MEAAGRRGAAPAPWVRYAGFWLGVAPQLRRRSGRLTVGRTLPPNPRRRGVSGLRWALVGGGGVGAESSLRGRGFRLADAPSRHPGGLLSRILREGPRATRAPL